MTTVEEPPVISRPDVWHHAIKFELLAGCTGEGPAKVDDMYGT
jgi:hypothetical protein